MDVLHFLCGINSSHHCTLSTAMMAWRSFRWLFLLVLLLFLLSMALPTPLMWGVLFSRTNTQQVSLHFRIVAAAVNLCCAEQFSSTNLYEVFVYESKS
jgi:hypothetical protein